MKKALSLLLAALMLLALTAACAADEELPSIAPPSAGGDDPPPPLPSPSVAEIVEEDPDLDGVFFRDTRQISVLVFDRSTDPGTPAGDNIYTDFLKAEALKLHNIEVTEYVTVSRWDEQDIIPMWLAGGDCPDVCVTYNFQAIQEYAAMDAVHDLAPLVDGYRDRLPHMWDLLTESNIYGARNPETGAIYWIETMLANNLRLNTFIREDWLNALNLPIPTTTQQFEDALVAFRDNAETLLPGNADRMIPFQINSDPGWTAQNLLASFISTGLTTKEHYAMGYDSRLFMLPGIKEGVRLLNKWYNMGLIWNDFAIYKANDSIVDDNLSIGYVGAFQHNWDYPYRADTNITNILREQAGPEATYLAINPFDDDRGGYQKFLGNSFDRKIFFPKTNQDPKASIFYVDMISRPEILVFMQLGVEGINYDVVDGVPVARNYSADDDPAAFEAYVPYILNSVYNIDLTPVINGFYAGNPLTAGAYATNYSGIEPRLISEAIEEGRRDGFVRPNFNVGEITSESGKSAVLDDKRDTTFNQSIIASPDAFDSTFDTGMADYLASGGQAIIDERLERYERAFPGE
ncbi:MAG: sugar ABC transporter substrate-binding protein [Oscillospiraceae bacterium]|jgi:putative aldouronate transport system substrate-binding protein|nr:sugar ABC transporter substrate-binding protein [Oscillospiraceae bacterium]